MWSGLKHCVIVGIIFCLSGAAVTAANVAEATRAARAPKIDGRLDDACWRQAKPIASFLIMGTTKAPKCGTSARFVYGDDALYIGVRCNDPDVSSIKTKEVPRDSGGVFSTDCIEIMLDATAGKNDYYHFAVNASGSIFDRACTQGGHIGDEKWDADVTAASFIGDTFWSCEVRIPFYSLGITPNVKSTWGVNLCREKMSPLELSSIGEKGAFNIAGSFAEMRGLDVDFSLYCYRIGVPTVTTAIVDGALHVQLDAPLKNETGQRKDILLESWLISPTKKPHIASDRITAPAGEEQRYAMGKFTLTEQGDYDYVVRVSDPTTKKSLAERKGALRIEFVPLAIRLVEPWYRDAIFETQKIKEVVLEVEARLKPEELRGSVLEVSIRPAGSTAAISAKEIADPAGKNRIIFEAAKLPHGKLEIVAAVKGQDGETKAETRHSLLKLPYKKGEVWLGKDMQWHVDGEPFFINGAWNHTEDFIPEYNVFTTEMPGDTKLLWCGLMNRLYHEAKSLREKSLSDKDTALCRKLVREVRDKANLFAYYLSDEPEISGVTDTALEQAYQVIREEDPYHPVVISNDTVGGVYTFARTGEINGLHPYPVILKDKRINDLSRVAFFVESAVKYFRESSHKQTVAYLHQGFNYGDYGAVNNRIPSYVEYRNQDLLALICGANGFIQFNRIVAHYPELYIGMPHLTREFAYLGPVVLAPKATVIPTASSDKMKMLLKDVEGDLYLLACNADMEPREVKITIPGIGKRVKKLKVVSEGRDVLLRGDVLADKFDTFEVHIYTTSAKKSGLLAVQEICKQIEEANQKRKKPGNVAFQMFEGDGVIPRASSSEAGKFRRLDNGLWHVVDGVIDTIDYYNAVTWKDTTPNAFPDWLEIQLPEAHSVERVVVSPMAKSLKDYSVQAWVGGKWIDLDKVSGKNHNQIVHAFAPVKTDRIRLFVTATNGPNSWVSEVEVYER